jgi:hypothetical protein
MFKFKLGMIIATVYLLLFLIVIIELNVSRPDALSGLGVIFLTAPWSLIFLNTFNENGVLASARSPFTFYALITFCALINALILYLLGNLLIKVLNFFRRKEKNFE